jgi:hypothetical protein
MSVVEVDFASAPTALVLDTPTSLDIETTPGVYQLVLDTNALIAGDILVIRSKIKVVSGGTARLFEEEVVAGVTASKAYSTEPVAVAWEIEYELEQTDGVGAVVPWSVLRS